MIYLKTGQPGHGKTLRAIEMALEFQAKGREVYACGVRGLKYADAGFHELTDATKWQDLPDGSVVLIDECYTVFPRGGATAKVPDFIEKLATHRHRGFDFILVCQQASKQLHPFIQGLVDQHEHIRRKFGFKKAIILSWDRYESNTRNSDSKKFWSYPNALMRRNLYESTVQDTTEKRIPWWLWAGPLLVLGIAYLVHNSKQFWDGKAHAESTPAGSEARSGSLVGGGQSQAKRPEDLSKFLTPRIPGMPWTAPAYDDRPVVSEPELYCIAVDDGRCSCITEQGTRQQIEPKLCRMIAANGAYNPTRRPAQDRVQQPPQERPARDTAPSGSQPSVVSADGLSSGWKSGVGSQAYQPPGSMPWNSDPWGGQKRH